MTIAVGVATDGVARNEERNDRAGKYNNLQ